MVSVTADGDSAMAREVAAVRRGFQVFAGDPKLTDKSRNCEVQGEGGGQRCLTEIVGNFYPK